MSVDGVPLKANGVLDIIVAQKLKGKVEEFPVSKDPVGGNSTLQNEVLGDLQMEFKSAEIFGTVIQHKYGVWIMCWVIFWHSGQKYFGFGILHGLWGNAWWL